MPWPAPLQATSCGPGTTEKSRCRSEGIATAGLTNQDFMDAALCALAAQHLGNGPVRTFGDAEGGFIVVPAGAWRGDEVS